MLGKLLKHEFKANIKTYAPITIIFFITSILIRIVSIIYNAVIKNAVEEPVALLITLISLSTALFAGIFGLCFYSAIGSSSRFQKNLFTDEGYLMHTLPVPSHYHIFSKFLIGVLFFAINLLVCILCVFIAFLDSEDIISFFDVFATMAEALANLFKESPLEAILTIILIISVYCAFNLLLYISTAISHFASKSKKTISSLIIIGAFIINNLITSIASTVITQSNLELSVASGLLIAISYYALITIGFFFALNSILNKHLNLE